MTSLDQPAADADRSATEQDGTHLTGLLLVAAAVSAISALLYGYDTGIISAALLQIRDDFETILTDNGFTTSAALRVSVAWA